MPLRIDTESSPVRILLEGVVTIEETDQLLEALAEHPDAGVDLSACDHLHTAPLQLLKFRKIPVLAPPADLFWMRCLATIAAQPVTDTEQTAETEEGITQDNQENEWGLFE